MRHFLFSLTFFVAIKTWGQNTFTGQMLSIIDSTPLSNFYFSVNQRELNKTDSLGYFSITTHKKEVRVSTFGRNHGLDTILTNSHNYQVKLYTIQHVDSATAVFDIQQNNLQLFCGASITPLAPMPTDKDFEKAYQTRYYIIGDFLPSSTQQMTAYNKVVAYYLDTKYGTEWRSKVRPDVLGVTRE